jgi:hypothetical protein
MIRRLLTAACLLALLGCGKKLPTPALQPGTEPGVPRRALLELFTATWCSNCPTADSAAERLAQELPDSVTLIEYHFNSGGDPFSYNQAAARESYYSVALTGVPHLRCDGIVQQVGTVPPPYPGYRTAVANRLLKPSPCELSLSGQMTGGAISYTARIKAVASAATSGDLRLMLLVLEDSCYHAGAYGGPYYRHVVRQMVPGAAGDALSLPLNSTVTRTGSIPMDPAWIPSRLHLVGFVQDFTTKEVLQSANLDLSVPAYDFNMTATDTVITVLADSLAEYSFTLQNTGTETDSVWLDLPDSMIIDPSEGSLVKALCTKTQCFPTPHMVALAPGATVDDLVIHLSDFLPDHYMVTLAMSSISRPDVKRFIRFHLYVVSTK